jgi:hypothetical protein
MTKNETDVRVLLRQDTQLILGPLGCFDIADKPVIEGTEYVVVAIDHDGAGIARPKQELRDLADSKFGGDARATMESLAKIRTAFPPSWLTPVAEAGLAAQWERNRREFCA